MTKNDYISKIFANEDQFQAATYLYINNNYPKLRKLIFHVPNEGARSKQEAMKLKSMGVLAGVPDLILLKPLCGIELKMPNGVVSASQKDIHTIWGANGIPVYTCWNAAEVCNVLENILNL
jgi:hypothetical protein